VITALGKTWHPEHFTCKQCNAELGTRNFFERDGAPYCETDYHNLFSPRCAYCNGPILDVRPRETDFPDQKKNVCCFAC
jgi:paxillin